MLVTFLVLCVTRTLRKGTINVVNKHTSTVQLYGGDPSPCRQSHVVRFPGGRVKSIEMYSYTRSTWSQSWTVVQHTVFDVQASMRLVYTCNTVVLFKIIIIIAVGVSAHAVAGSLA